MIVIAVAVVILALVIAMIVAVAMERNASPPDVAIGYEHAWDRLDFDAVYKLSGQDLQDGLTRQQFVAAKAGAYREQGQLGHLIEEAAVDAQSVRGDTATVDTRLVMRDGSTVRNRVELVRRNREWLVVGYDLRPAAT